MARRLRDAYLGFVVVRPIPASPLGRTVLAWYPDARAASLPRVVAPSREYACHLGGMRLTVQGLAWQQQDTAVGACATIALWSMLHSSALDGQHALPTTASVTQSAHRTAPFGKRVFPNAGLNIQQLCEAIKEHGLSPVVIPGDIVRAGEGGAHQPRFSRERFAASCAAMIRSGYPTLVLGDLAGGGHATCAVGFRSAAPPLALQGTVVHHDADIPYFYIHDDNLGPSVRFSISVDQDGAVNLKPDAPARVATTSTSDPTLTYPALIPGHLVVAVPDDLRTSPDALNVAGLDAAMKMSRLFDATAKQTGAALPGLTMSSRFSRLRDYLSRDLEQGHLRQRYESPGVRLCRVHVGPRPRAASDDRRWRAPPDKLHRRLVTRKATGQEPCERSTATSTAGRARAGRRGGGAGPRGARPRSAGRWGSRGPGGRRARR